MEEENVKKSFIKKHFKLLLILIVILIIAIVVFNVVIGSPKKTVEKFIEAFNDRDTITIAESVDLKSAYVLFEKCDLRERKFDDEYYDFEEDSTYEYLVESFEDQADDFFDEIDEYDLEISITEIGDVKKSKRSKMLYEVDVKLKVEYEDYYYNYDYDYDYDDYDDYDDEDQIEKIKAKGTIFVIRDGLSYKIVGCDTSLANDLDI